MVIDWRQKIQAWYAITQLRTFPPVSEALLENARARVKNLPIDLEGLYKATNGLSAGPFKILPVEDRTDLKRTWDSLQRANEPHATRFLSRSPQLLDQFIVFADIGMGRAAAYDRGDGSIWYEEDAQLRQTDLSLDDFVQATLRDIAESYD
jgi:hypothetical protein